MESAVRNLINFFMSPVPFMALVGLLFFTSCRTQYNVSSPYAGEEPGQHVIFDHTGNPSVIEAIQKAEDCINSKKFIDNLVNYSYKYTDKSPEEIKEHVKSVKKEAHIYFYRSWNPLSSAIAYTEGNKISLNLWKNPRPVREMFKTIVHEFFHVLGFSHPFYDVKDRGESVPYMVELIAVESCL